MGRVKKKMGKNGEEGGENEEEVHVQPENPVGDLTPTVNTSDASVMAIETKLIEKNEKDLFSKKERPPKSPSGKSDDEYKTR